MGERAYERAYLLELLERFEHAREWLKSIEHINRVLPYVSKEENEDLYTGCIRISIWAQDIEPLLERVSSIREMYKAGVESQCVHNWAEDWVDLPADSYGSRSSKVIYCSLCGKTKTSVRV